MAGKCGLGRKREIKSRSSLNIMTALDPSQSVAAPPAARRSCLASRPAAGLAWPPHMGRAVRACSDAVMAGWIARQAIVSGGRRLGEVDAWRSLVWMTWISGLQQAPGLAFAALPAACRSRLAFGPAAGLPGRRPCAGPSGSATMPSGRADLHEGRSWTVAECQQSCNINNFIYINFIFSPSFEFISSRVNFSNIRKWTFWSKSRIAFSFSILLPLSLSTKREFCSEINLFAIFSSIGEIIMLKGYSLPLSTRY